MVINDQFLTKGTAPCDLAFEGNSAENILQGFRVSINVAIFESSILIELFILNHPAIGVLHENPQLNRGGQQ